jgi:transposase
MEQKTRRRFSREFKLEAVRQFEAGVRLAELARELDVSPSVLRRWRNRVTEDPDTAFPGNGRRRWPEDEVEQLRKELAQVRAERDFLKKRQRTSRNTRDEVCGNSRLSRSAHLAAALCDAGCGAQYVLRMAAPAGEYPGLRESRVGGAHAAHSRGSGSDLWQSPHASGSAGPGLPVWTPSRGAVDVRRGDPREARQALPGDHRLGTPGRWPPIAWRGRLRSRVPMRSGWGITPMSGRARAGAGRSSSVPSFV